MSKKLTIEFCRVEAKKRGYKIISTEYTKAIEKLTFFHIECGTSSDMLWSNFYSGHGCKKCASRKYGDTLLLNLEDCKEYALSQGYILNEDLYSGNSKKMNFIHIENNCNHPYCSSWSNFYAGKRCPKCAGNIRLTIDFCKQKSLDLGFELITNEYINNSTKMTFYHPDCDEEFSCSWDKFIRLSGCKACTMRMQQSPEATKLKEYYETNFGAIPEYKIVRNPKTNRPLPYDIFIPKYNNDGYDVFIEVQGHQHYRFDNFYHKTLEDFKNRQYKDRIKRKYAEQNGIYIEIDLRQKTPIEDIIQKINNTINRYG